MVAGINQRQLRSLGQKGLEEAPSSTFLPRSDWPPESQDCPPIHGGLIFPWERPDPDMQATGAEGAQHHLGFASLQHQLFQRPKKSPSVAFWAAHCLAQTVCPWQPTASYHLSFHEVPSETAYWIWTTVLIPESLLLCGSELLPVRALRQWRAACSWGRSRVSP